ncbi:hypothetical protein EDD15DRAFT_2524890 [Pisolithus albus]|nr:hypothetical protein EDD15DRAFT_2524890 [Pisolithus albus]
MTKLSAPGTSCARVGTYSYCRYAGTLFRGPSVRGSHSLAELAEADRSDGLALDDAFDKDVCHNVTHLRDLTFTGLDPFHVLGAFRGMEGNPSSTDLLTFQSQPWRIDFFAIALPIHHGCGRKRSTIFEGISARQSIHYCDPRTNLDGKGSEAEKAPLFNLILGRPSGLSSASENLRRGVGELGQPALTGRQVSVAVLAGAKSITQREEEGPADTPESGQLPTAARSALIPWEYDSTASKVGLKQIQQTSGYWWYGGLEHVNGYWTSETYYITHGKIEMLYQS